MVQPKKKKKKSVDQIIHCPSWDTLRMSRAVNDILEIKDINENIPGKLWYVVILFMKCLLYV